jgi:AcrR family transcriptional regulator
LVASSSQVTGGSRRAYVSPRREAAARATRRAILDAALALFVDHGYASTSREAIAQRAGVAVQTVAAVFGTKRAILDALVDAATRGDGSLPSPAMRSWPQELREQPDAAALLRHHAASACRVSRSIASLMEVVRRAAAADAGIAELWHALQQQRLRGQATVVELLSSRAPLRPGLSRAEAADVLWALTDDSLQHALAVERGWPPERVEAWLGDTMCGALLGA